MKDNLFYLFLVNAASAILALLKITGLIQLSWLWVLSPIWIGHLFMCLVAVVALFLVGVIELLKTEKKNAS